VARRPDLHVFVLTDPDDLVISARSQTAYARRLAAAGVSVRQIFLAARDPSAHGLFNEVRRLAAACAKGISEDTIVAMFENKRPPTPPDADEPPLHSADLLQRPVTLSEKQCSAVPTALWVRVRDRSYCVRSWMSTAGGTNDHPIVFLHGDLGDHKRPGKLNRPSERMTASELQRTAQFWSRTYGGPYIAVGRLGALGSSGDHRRDRKTLTEFQVVSAALDALKERHHFATFHLVGQSGGGHTVAALMETRSDIGCAVMTSGAISVRSSWQDRVGRVPAASLNTRYDPIDFIRTMQPRPGLRMFVLADPDDHLVSFRSQREFVERVKSKGLPILLITAAAGDEDHHGLQSQGLRLAIDCIKGVDDQTLVTRYQTKPVPAAARDTTAARR